MSNDGNSDNVHAASALATPARAGWLVHPISGSNISVFADSLSVEGGALIFWKGGVISEVYSPASYLWAKKT